jgi:PST family polysaccharide transporter
MTSRDTSTPGETAQPPARPSEAGPPDPFRTDHLKGDLARRSARGGVVTVGAQVTKLMLQLGATALLARLLTPADFGVFAMVAVFTGFIARFRDLGLSAATVQRAEVDHSHASTLFWVNVAGGVTLMILGIAIAPLVASFYGMQALTAITIALSVTFLFAGISAQHIALLRRQMRFKALACVDVGSMACGITAAILIALYGGSYWALVGQAVVHAVAELALCTLLSGWRPGRWRMSQDVREMLRFGGTLTAAGIVNYFSRNFDNLVIGRFAGAAQLGVYSKAYALLLMPVQQINGPIAAVAIPAMARLQDQPAEYRRYYLKVIQIIAYVSMPLAVLLGVLAEEVVLILLGPQWHEAARIFQILALFVVVQNVSVTTGWVMQSLGRAKRLLKWQAIHALVFVIACFIGVRWGAVGVAMVTTIQGLLAMLPAMWVAYNGSPVTLRDVMRTIAKPVLIAAVLFVVTWSVHSLVQAQPVSLRVGAVLTAAACVAAIVLLAVSAVRRDLHSMLVVFRNAQT